MSTNQGSSSGVPAGYYQPQNYPPQGSYVAPLKNNDGANTNNNNSSNNKEHSSSSSSSTPRTLAHALLPDLPLLMHGSGDVRIMCVVLFLIIMEALHSVVVLENVDSRGETAV